MFKFTGKRLTAAAGVAAIVAMLFGGVNSGEATAATPPGGGLSAADVSNVQKVGFELTTTKAGSAGKGGKTVKAVKVKGDKVFDALYGDVHIYTEAGDDEVPGLRAGNLVVVQSTGTDLPTGRGHSGVKLDPNTVITLVMTESGRVVATSGATAKTPGSAAEKKDLVNTFGSDVATITVNAG